MTWPEAFFGAALAASFCGVMWAFFWGISR